jgi:predicted HicB family RNase H-like nuclease
MDVARTETQTDKNQEARRLAADKYRVEPDWVKFYREVLGVEGIIDHLFPSFEERCKFEQSLEYAEIQQMLARLRERNRIQKQGDEATRVITVRLPESLHQSLRHEAHNLKTSMNKLCISKLLQVVADDLVPSDFQRREPEPPSRPRPETPKYAPTIEPTTSPMTRTAPAQTASTVQPTPRQPMTRPPMQGGRPF